MNKLFFKLVSYHREGWLQGQSFIFLPEDNSAKQMLTKHQQWLRLLSKIEGQVFSLCYPAAHEAHVSHTG